MLIKMKTVQVPSDADEQWASAESMPIERPEILIPRLLIDLHAVLHSAREISNKPHFKLSVIQISYKISNDK